jgi:glycosyltransferase involved in cell wall biosynthesis
VLIPNFLDSPPVDLPETARTQVLWVGKLRAIKRPLMFVALAKALPQLSFTMIGPHFQDEIRLYEAVMAAAKTCRTWRCSVSSPCLRSSRHFNRCPSSGQHLGKEGFPNVFLQAMRRGIPIVSFVDPDGMVKAVIRSSA